MVVWCWFSWSVYMNASELCWGEARLSCVYRVRCLPFYFRALIDWLIGLDWTRLDSIGWEDFFFTPDNCEGRGRGVGRWRKRGRSNDSGSTMLVETMVLYGKTWAGNRHWSLACACSLHCSCSSSTFHSLQLFRPLKFHGRSYTPIHLHLFPSQSPGWKRKRCW